MCKSWYIRCEFSLWPLVSLVLHVVLHVSGREFMYLGNSNWRAAAADTGIYVILSMKRISYRKSLWTFTIRGILSDLSGNNSITIGKYHWEITIFTVVALRLGHLLYTHTLEPLQIWMNCLSGRQQHKQQLSHCKYVNFINNQTLAVITLASSNFVQVTALFREEQEANLYWHRYRIYLSSVIR